jgi:hypothetical protein
MDDVIEAYHADAEKPNTDDWRKDTPNSVCAIVLQSKQAYEYSARHGESYICTLTCCSKHLISCIYGLIKHNRYSQKNTKRLLSGAVKPAQLR